MLRMLIFLAVLVKVWQDFKQFEQEQSMSYVTTGERIGYERGQKEQAQNLILRLPQSECDVYDGLRLRIQSLALNQLEALGETLLDFTELDDLLTWLAANSVE